LKLSILRISVVVTILLIAAVMVYPSRVNANTYHTLQLALVLDGSGSITVEQWVVMVNGVAHAVEEHLVHDGSVELTVVQFSSFLSETWGSVNFGAKTYVPPTVITTSNFAAVATTIRGIVQAVGQTPQADGVWVGWLNIANSPNFGTFEKQIIDIATDEGPNVRWSDTTNPFYHGGVGYDADTDVTDARNAAVAAGLDELDVEAFMFLGEFPNAVDPYWLRDYVAWPQPGNFAPPFTPGWVQVVTSAEEMADAMAIKLEMYNPTPPPPTPTSPPKFVGGVLTPVNKLAILAPYLALIGLIGALSTTCVLRRRRRT
jgi:hypothetical protein